MYLCNGSGSPGVFLQVSLRHAPAEATGEPSNKFDLATICLVNHESPEWVSKAMFKEAFRVLRPGGVFTILDLDKNNLAILLENPFVAAVYKQVCVCVCVFVIVS